MPDLKPVYMNSDENIQEIFRVSTVDKSWVPNYYNTFVSDPEIQIIEDMYYQVRRVSDNQIVVPFGTGSYSHTRLSYDISGSYFLFEPILLEPGFAYQYEFCFKKTSSRFEKFQQVFKFRVDE
jgi:hypothetical protein